MRCGGAAGARRDVMLSHALFSGWRKRQFATISTDSQNRRLLSRRRAIKQDTRHSITTLNLNKSSRTYTYLHCTFFGNCPLFIMVLDRILRVIGNILLYIIVWLLIFTVKVSCWWYNQYNNSGHLHCVNGVDYEEELKNMLPSQNLWNITYSLNIAVLASLGSLRICQNYIYNVM